MDNSKLSSPELQHFLTIAGIFTLIWTEVELVYALKEILKQEKEKALVNEMVAKLTNVCWDKCITSTPGSKFSSSEVSCLTNCAQRYLDMSLIIMKRFQSMH